MIRPSFSEVWMTLATALSRRSTCQRLQVGCVIVSHDNAQVLAVGYNGGAAGLENDCASLEPGQCGHLHAEENATIHCSAPRSEPKYVYTTNLPCPMCCKRLINLGGVQALWYKHDYRVRDGLELLERSRIRTMQWPTSLLDQAEDNLTRV